MRYFEDVPLRRALGRRWKRLGIWSAVAIAAFAIGCNRGSDKIGRVSGRVTLNGQPLADALVVFDPVQQGGSSYARTNSNGRYELTYTPEIPGAEIGSHMVRITSGWPGDSFAHPPIPPTPERVPAKFNTQTELKCDVKSGSNTFDFDLK